MRPPTLRLWAAAAVLAGCGGRDFADGPAADGGPGDDAGDGDFEPAPPAAPEPPRITPCPEGWREVVDPDDPTLVACDPWPEGGPEDCVGDEAHFPGSPGCERIGTPCPAGDFADDIPAERTALYVLGGAPAGGDGSLAAPFASIQDAVDAAPAGAVVAISKGTFDEVVTLGRSVTLWGACVAETRVVPSLASESDPAIDVRAGAEVRNLQVSGRRKGIAVHANGSAATLESVVVEGVVSMGIDVYSRGELVAHELVVRDTEARDSDGLRGRALNVEGGSNVELDRAAFERDRDVAIFLANAETELVATDLVVRDTRGLENGDLRGRGLSLQEGARAEITRAAFERNREVAILAIDAVTALVATDVVVRDTQEVGGLYGHGLEVNGGASAQILRGLFEQNREVAILVQDAETELLATDVAVRDTQASSSDQADGGGLEVHGGARAEVVRGAFVRNRDIGIFATEAGTELVATDVAVRGTQARESDGTFGHGLEVLGGATGEILRAAFVNNREAGVLVAEAGTELVATDVVARDTQAREIGGVFGRGLQVGGGARVEVLRGAFEGNHDVGILAGEIDTELVATDVAVRDTQPEVSSGDWGVGLQVQVGASANLVRAVFERNARVGVSASGLAVQVIVTDLRIVETQATQCVPDCPGFGIGLGAYDFASVAVTGLRISDNALCGVQVATGGAVDLHGGEISGNPIGANVQTEDFDPNRLRDGVLYFDNDQDLDAAVLPVPDIAEGMGT